MWKRLIIAFILIMIILSGCGKAERYVDRNSYNRFRVVETYGDCTILQDVDTGICYCLYQDNGHDEIFPFYDADGNLYRPNGWRDFGGMN